MMDQRYRARASISLSSTSDISPPPFRALGRFRLNDQYSTPSGSSLKTDDNDDSDPHSNDESINSIRKNESLGATLSRARCSDPVTPPAQQNPRDSTGRNSNVRTETWSKRKREIPTTNIRRRPSDHETPRDADLPPAHRSKRSPPETEDWSKIPSPYFSRGASKPSLHSLDKSQLSPVLGTPEGKRRTSLPWQKKGQVNDRREATAISSVSVSPRTRVVRRRVVRSLDGYIDIQPSKSVSKVRPTASLPLQTKISDTTRRTVDYHTEKFTDHHKYFPSKANNQLPDPDDVVPSIEASDVDHQIFPQRSAKVQNATIHRIPNVNVPVEKIVVAHSVQPQLRPTDTRSSLKDPGKDYRITFSSPQKEEEQEATNIMGEDAAYEDYSMFEQEQRQEEEEGEKGQRGDENDKGVEEIVIPGPSSRRHEPRRGMDGMEDFMDLPTRRPQRNHVPARIERATVPGPAVENNDMTGRNNQPGIDWSSDSDWEESDADDTEENEFGRADPDSEIPAHERAADFLIRLFTFNDFGCSPQQHADSQTASNHDHEGAQCYNLKRTFAHQSPMVHPVGEITGIGRTSTRFPDPIEANRSRFLRSRELRTLFEGAQSDAEVPAHICLGEDHLSGFGAAVEFDIDAFMVFMGSFQGIQPTYTINLSFTKEIRFNIDSDLHIKIPVNFINSNGKAASRLTQIQHIPHLYLGSMDVYPNTTIFVLFPRMVSTEDSLTGSNNESEKKKKKKKTSWLTDKHAAQFLDLWLQACRANTTQFASQYLPPNVESAEARARAKAIEHRSTTRKDVLKEIRRYPITAQEAQSAWESVHRTIQTDTKGLGIFKDARLFVNAKNTKLHDPASTLLETLQLFRIKMNDVFVSQSITYYADIGAKIVPLNSRNDIRQGPSQVTQRSPSRDSILSEPVPSGGTSSLPCTYLWRACCLDSLYDVIRRSAFGGRAGKKQIYYNGFLRDATTLTIEPPATSWIRQGDVLYFQAYNSVKEVTDAQQVHPFDRPYLSNLALPKDVVGPRTLSVDRGSLLQSYSGSKQRVFREYQNWQSTFFGVRFEVRSGGKTIDKMRSRLEAASTANQTAPSFGTATPGFVWCVPTRSWCEFMSGNYHKITSFIEMVVLSSPREGITLASSQLLFALFAYLKAFANSAPARKSLLWKEDEQRDNKDQLGFNLRGSISQHGFGWLAPLIDWQGLRLIPRAIGHLIGCGGTIGTGYHESMRQVQDQMAITELLCMHICDAHPDSRRLKVALKTLAHYVLRQYRRDVLKFLAGRGELHTKYMDSAEHDRVMFCDKVLCDVLVQRPFYVKPGKLNTGSHPIGLFTLLMGVDEDPNLISRRKHFDGTDKKDWRVTLRRVHSSLSKDVWLYSVWVDRLRREFKNYMFSIPYPDPAGVFLEKHTPTGQRKFFAAGSVDGEWRCLSHNPRQDIPPEYPKTLWMSLEELEGYLDKMAQSE